jgi:pimeloyl-ACP methyl ester carboxylesterase
MGSDYSARRSDERVGPLGLEGFLSIPDRAHGVVIFAHGSGSSRHSPRNAHVASALHDHSFATLLFDLLTADEGRSRKNVFDIELLSERVLDAVRWAVRDPRTERLPIGLFGASTGAAAALVAATMSGERVRAVVSRGGRPDLAGHALVHVHAPTLLIVGGADHGVVELNANAYDALCCQKRLEVIPGASHLFEEPGTLDKAIAAAARWFDLYLVKPFKYEPR